MSFAIRLNEKPGYKEILDQVFNEERFTKVLAVTHTGKTETNPHWHLIIETDYKQKALREYLLKHFAKGSGNGHLSIKTFDGRRKGYSYMFHEHGRATFQVVMNRGHTESELETYLNEHKNYATEIAKNSPIKIIERIAKQILAEMPKGYNIIGQHQKLCNYVWDELHDKGDWFPNKFQLERWIMKLQAVLAGKNTPSWQYTKDEWYDRFFH